MVRPRKRSFALVVVLALAGCRQDFTPTRSDATPFAAADSECWDYAGMVAPNDSNPTMYAKCMARHGWASCGRRPCKTDTW